jgi:hypothetical protein
MNYFIRPGQHLGVEKFQSKDHHTVYCWIKTVKKILAVDLSLYMLKKMLLMPSEIAFDCSVDFFFVFMCQPNLKDKFEAKIDHNRWSKHEFKLDIPLK